MNRLRAGVESLNRHGLAVLLLISAGLNLYQAFTIRQLQDSITPKAKDVLRIGTRFPSFGAHTLEGQAASVDFPSKLPTVIYSFSPRCGWCARNEQNVRFLATELSDKWNFVGVSIAGEGLKQYVDSRQLPFPVLTSPDARTVDAYRLGATPKTIVVSVDGRLLASWVGAYAGETAHAVENFFKVSLPGLSPSGISLGTEAPAQ